MLVGEDGVALRRPVSGEIARGDVGRAIRACCQRVAERRQPAIDFAPVARKAGAIGVEQGIQNDENVFACQLVDRRAQRRAIRSGRTVGGTRCRQRAQKPAEPLDMIGQPLAHGDLLAHNVGQGLQIGRQPFAVLAEDARGVGIFDQDAEFGDQVALRRFLVLDPR